MKAILLILILFPPVLLAGSSGTKKLYITNSAGDDVTVADPVTFKVLKTIKVGPRPHGVAVPAAANSILVSIEGGKQGELVWIDPFKDEVVGRMTIGPAPHQFAVTPDGKFAYVPVADGHYEVIDLAARKILHRIKTGGRPHNTLSSPDGKVMYLAPLGGTRKVFLADVATHKVMGEIAFSNSVRPIALSRDGRLFAEVDGLLGFEVADVAKRTKLHRIEAVFPPDMKKRVSRSHGLEIRPDQKEVWECDVENALVRVYDITGPVPKQVASIPVGAGAYWITFSPDGRFAFASLRAKNEVAVIDTASREVVGRIATGKEPKRLLVVTIP